MFSDIAVARSYCNSNSILCAGGSLNNSDILELVAWQSVNFAQISFCSLAQVC